MSKPGSQQCLVCEKKATHHCPVCRENICDFCSEGHQNVHKVAAKPDSQEVNADALRELLAKARGIHFHDPKYYCLPCHFTHELFVVLPTAFDQIAEQSHTISRLEGELREAKQIVAVVRQNKEK